MFKTNLNSEIFCLCFAQEMVNFFNISEEEAIQRINNSWKENDFTEENDMIYHEDPEFWAKTIYCRQNEWWNYKTEELTPKDL